MTDNAKTILLDSKDDSKSLNQLMDIMAVLSKSDALTIFLMANEGVKSDLDTPAKIGLTRKQYYTRLKQLVDLGLLVKFNESYTHTAFGRLVYQKHVIGITNYIKNSKYLEMVDALKISSKFNDKDILEFISKIDPQASVNLGLSSRKNITPTLSFEDMVKKVLEIIEFAQNEILLATRFQNELIINSVLKKANSGISVKVLADVNLVENYFEKESDIGKSDKNKDERINVVSNPYYPSKIDRRYTQVPFCILVVDNKHVGLEIISAQDPKKFQLAIFTEDESLSSSMMSLFANLWHKSKPNPPKIATKTV